MRLVSFGVVFKSRTALWRHGWSSLAGFGCQAFCRQWLQQELTTQALEHRTVRCVNEHVLCAPVVDWQT